MADEKLYLCFDIGGTTVKYGVLSEDRDFLEKGKYQTRKVSKEIFFNDLVKKIVEIQSAYRLEKIGISFPGFINPNSGYAEFAGAIDVLHGSNLLKMLNMEIQLPVIIENDANCATLAEKLSGNATDCSNFVCMTIGTGIGGGLFINNQLVNGHTYKAGEFGLMIINGMDKGYKNMHEIASTSGLIHQYKLLKNIPENHFIEGEQIFDDSIKDKDVKHLLDQWFCNISYGIFNLAATVNPEKILLGGAISIRDDLYTLLEEKLNMIPSWKDIEVPVEPCKHHNDAGMLGILYKCLEEAEDDQ
ncbi:ROK family protein [Gracilibacillus ureilyticus]|nr:ROK family protein [Gracilibacillus ureilyticus]